MSNIDQPESSAGVTSPGVPPQATGSASAEAAKNIRYIHWRSYPRDTDLVAAYAEIIEQEFRSAVREAAEEIAERSWRDLQTQHYTLTTDDVEQRIAARLFRPNK